MVSVIADEVKRNAVASTPEQGERWVHWLARAEQAGRAHPVPGTSTVIGARWRIACEDRDDAEWLCGWLQEACGFGPTMLRISQKRG